MLMTATTTLQSGDSDLTLDQGFYRLASLGDYVWFDFDIDGLQDDTEVGVENATVHLKDANGNIIDTTQTNSSGYYLFDNLVPGTYSVQFVLPAGYDGFTGENEGSDDAIDSDADPSLGFMTAPVTLVSGEHNPTLDAGVYRQLPPPPAPGIDLEKTTDGITNTNPVDSDYDNEDAADGAGVPVLTPGTVVTWTYKVTNTGNTDFAFNQVVLVDDNGTPADTSDDLSTTNGQITFLSVDTGDADNVLEPGEVWLYTASGVVQTLNTLGATSTFYFNGSGSTDGMDGNIRTYTSGSLSVNASAWSRDKSTGAWSEAFLGIYGGGLGVTDSSEGTGGSNSHTVDNTGRDNYVMFEFSDTVVVDAAYLGYVVNDSDLKIWIGTVTDAFDSHIALNDSVLTSLGFTELNSTTLSTARWADFNSGNVSGNVLIIAADTTDTSPEDYFKIQKVKVQGVTQDIYENKATVTVPGDEDSDLSHYRTNDEPANPGIDIEKTTGGLNNFNTTTPDYDNEDSANGAGVPVFNPGQAITWTYQVTNTGNVPFTMDQVVVVDDAGTPDDSSDDMSTSNGQITFQSVASGDNDNLLEPGEIWLYTASGVAQNVTSVGETSTFYFNGSSYTDGADGNTRSYTAGSVGVNVSAWSRDKSTGVFSPSYLGVYSGGLGVTDSTEGSGGSNMHTVDNVGRDNYVMFEFSDTVVVDAAYLGYVVDDSDVQIWIGTITDAFNDHVTLNASVLSSLGFTELNSTTSTSARWADFNSGNVAGNVLIIAADTTDTSPEDRFKIQKVKVQTTTPGVYENKATVTVPGDSDNDLSHYRNTQKASLGNLVWDDVDRDGVQDGNEPGVSGATVQLKDANGNVIASQTTDSNGNYLFDNLTPGTYSVQFALPSGFAGFTSANTGSNDDLDSDANPAMGYMSQQVTLGSGEVNLSVDAGLLRPVIDECCVDITFCFSGCDPVCGTAGNIETFTVNGVSVKASAFSRTTGGTWNTAYLGVYGEGLGVTDGSESGSNGTHRLDNVGRYNYILFEFSEQVKVDKAFLDSVVCDSDITVWIGNVEDVYNNHMTLSDAKLSSLGFTEVNNTTSSYDRWADINNGGVKGNVLIIAASTSDSTPDDQFKLAKLNVCAPEPDTKFYVVDPSADKTFEYTRDGLAVTNNGLSSYYGNTNARGTTTTAVGDKVWVIDANKKVYVYDNAGKLLGAWTANGLTSPEGITTDGTDIWIVDNGCDKVFRFAGAATRLSGSQSAASSFSLNSSNTNAMGLVTDGTSIWVVNSASTDKVFKYSKTGTLQGSWTIDSRNCSPTDLTIDPSNPSAIWVVDNSTDSVYQYNTAVGRTSGSQTAAKVFKLANGNCDPQGIADPPPAADVDLSSLVQSADDLRDIRRDALKAQGGDALGWLGQHQQGKTVGLRELRSHWADDADTDSELPAWARGSSVTLKMLGQH
jgi:hypothetical protein